MEGRSFLASTRGRAKADRKSCGRNAKDSSLMGDLLMLFEDMYSRVL